MLTNDDLQRIKEIVNESVRVQIAPMQKELKEVREDIKTVDMKVEMFNVKLDKKIDKVYKDMTAGFGQVIDAIDNAFGPLNNRVKKLEN